MNDPRLRREILAGFGAAPPEVDELLRYGDGGFRTPPDGLPRSYPLPDEPFVRAWEGYVRQAANGGVLPTLREHLVQLCFPVESGIATSPAYLAAVRKGVRPPEKGRRPLELRTPRALALFLHPTPAGRVPVLTTPDREDFLSLVRALSRRNEPEPIPDSMGACVVAGYNNWSRVAEQKSAWRAGHPRAPEHCWDDAFRALIPRKELYQDRFILLSGGPYSGVPAANLGLDPDDAERSARTLRLEHECAHYFCRRVWGSMRNSVLDELIADFVGIVEAAGRFRPEWMLRFFGLEDFPRYRPGARLQNYLGAPPLSAGAFAVLRRLVVAAAENLEAYARQLEAGPGPMGWKVSALTTLPLLSLETIAALPPGSWSAVRAACPPPTPHVS